LKQKTKTYVFIVLNQKYQLTMKLIKSVLFFVSVVIFVSCEKKETKKMFADAEKKIETYRSKGGELFSKDQKLAISYFQDSVYSVVINSYIGDYKFIRLDGTTLDTKNITRPIYLQLSGRTCAPCVAELPALNDIVDKYSDKIEFIMLEADPKEILDKVVDQYNKKINLIYLPFEENNNRKGNGPYSFSGFKHLIGSFPTNYLIDKNRKIIKTTGGAVVPKKYVNEQGDTIVVTKEDAYKKNFKKLDEEMKTLLNN
tara:strand:+ start:2472 stop:3239 length:768 start_codon:yes stop_codon:yes gene_type:complete